MTSSRLNISELDGGELRVELGAPECANALDLATVQALAEAMSRAPERTVVLMSAVPRVFCGGADLSISPAERAEVSDQLHHLYELMITRPGPVIAVIEGSAVGGGAQLCSAADLRIASPAARWRWVGPGHGLAVGAWILPELVGRTWALELTMTSRWLDADTAVSNGFIIKTSADPVAELAEVLSSLSAAHPAALARVKNIATHPDLLDRLRTERVENAASWDGTAPPPPTSNLKEH